jgi:hypothetical protein
MFLVQIPSGPPFPRTGSATIHPFQGLDPLRFTLSKDWAWIGFYANRHCLVEEKKQYRMNSRTLVMKGLMMKLQK